MLRVKRSCSVRVSFDIWFELFYSRFGICIIHEYNYLPSAYTGGSNFKKGAPRAPQTGCRILLQAPEGVLYLLGGQGLSGMILQGASFDSGLFWYLEKSKDLYKINLIN